MKRNILTSPNSVLYQQMKAMRTDIQVIEKIRKIVDGLVRSEEPKIKGHEYGR